MQPHSHLISAEVVCDILRAKYKKKHENEIPLSLLKSIRRDEREVIRCALRQRIRGNYVSLLFLRGCSLARSNYCDQISRVCKTYDDNVIFLHVTLLLPTDTYKKKTSFVYKNA